LEEHIDTAFHAHPDAPILSSIPGLGVALGARLLAEIGDDRSRFADARGLKAFAGAAPVTRASGTRVPQLVQCDSPWLRGLTCGNVPFAGWTACI
jgi:transposase